MFIREDLNEFYGRDLTETEKNTLSAISLKMTEEIEKSLLPVMEMQKNLSNVLSVVSDNFKGINIDPMMFKAYSELLDSSNKTMKMLEMSDIAKSALESVAHIQMDIDNILPTFIQNDEPLAYYVAPKVLFEDIKSPLPSMLDVQEETNKKFTELIELTKKSLTNDEKKIKILESINENTSNISIVINILRNNPNRTDEILEALDEIQSLSACSTRV